MRVATVDPKFDSPFPGSPGTQTPSNFGAPAMTLSGYENKIRDHANAHPEQLAVFGVQVSRGKVKTLAYRMFKRRIPPTDANLARILQYSDPTADEAIRNVMAGGAS